MKNLLLISLLVTTTACTNTIRGAWLDAQAQYKLAMGQGVPEVIPAKYAEDTPTLAPLKFED